MMRARSFGWVLIAALATATGPGCGGDRAAATPASPSPVTTPAPTANVCAPGASSPGGRVTDPNGPYFHRVAYGRLVAGPRVADSRHVLEHASVPDGVRAPDGRVLVYYVNGDDGGVWVATLSEASASTIGPIAVNGVSRPAGIVDPDAFVVGGRIRLAYLAGFAGAGASRAMCLAESDDGVNFTAIGAALTVSGETWTDPSVTRTRDGQWLMAISAGNQTVLARSSDGTAFVAGERLTFGGVPEVALLDDGRVRLYVCAQGIQSYVSTDDGASWRFESTVVPGPGLICDPSHVAGTDLFVYKTGY
jgi:hypothetical protein